jgi:hypothetical protein
MLEQMGVEIAFGGVPTMKATTTPHSSSGAPTTHASRTSGCSISTRPRGVDVASPLMTTSFERSRRVRNPRASKAMSPVCSHPLQGGCRRVGVVPVARHHDVTTAGDLTDHVDTGRRPVCRAPDVHPGARVPDRAERVVGVQAVGAPGL